MGSRRPTIGVGTLEITPAAKRLVMQALDQNRLSYGPFSRELEERFAELHGCRFGVLSNSGTSALHVAIGALKEIHEWKDGDEVIVPALTFVATVNVVLHNNLKPVLVDVDPTYYELDPDLLEDAISQRTRAIIPVHLFGQPCDMDPILKLAQRQDLRVVEDSCETMFAHYRGRSVGSMGDIGCFSTYVAHLLTTGVGGLNTTNVPEYAVKLRSLVNHGRDSIYLSIDDDDNLGIDRLRTVVERRFRFISAGHSFRVTEMEAALGVAQLDDWEEMIAQRRANAAFLRRALEPLEDRLQLPAIRPGNEHSFMMFPLVLRDEPKDDLVLFLEERGIETREMFPLTNQPVYARTLGTREADFPVAQHINRRGFYIGCHQHLSPSDLDYVVDVFNEYWRRKATTARPSTLLLLVATRSGPTTAEIIERLPLELFDRVQLLQRRADPHLDVLLDDQPVERVQTEVRDPWSYLRATDLPERYENVVVFSLDGRDDPDVVTRLLLSLERGNDMVIASRFSVGSGATVGNASVSRRLGNRLFTLLANLAFSGNVTDSLSVVRGVRGRRLRAAAVHQSGLVASYELSISAMKQRWRVAEVPTAEQPMRDRFRTLQALGSVVPLIASLIMHLFRRRVATDESGR